MKNHVLLISSMMCVCFAGTLFALDYETPIINKYGQTGLFNCQSAKTLGMGRLSIVAYGNYSSHKDFVRWVADDSGDVNDTNNWADTLKSPSYAISAMNFGIGYGITRYLDLAVMLPLYLENIASYSEPNKNSFGGSTIGGIGDVEISMKFQYPPYPHRKFFEMAYYGALTLGTGDQVNANFIRHTYYFLKDTSVIKPSNDTIGIADDYYTSRSPELDIKMLWTFDFDKLRGGVPVELHINYGIRWTKAELDHIFLLNTGLSYRPANWLTLFTEFSGETRVANVDRGFKIGDDPLRLSPGITLTPPGGFFLSLGMDISLTSKKTLLKYYVMDDNNDEKVILTEIEPQYRFAGAIGWAGFIMPQDRDKDGIKDNEDRCPKDPEDFDGFEDGDGCPEVDNDGDGVPDSLDRCPNEKEDPDGFADKDGCPDFDNDKDGVIDVNDKCPNVAEDLDGFEDDDGCPDTDNDGDGIIDSLDKCPDKAEDKDGFEDADGCPDFDNDMDGIADSVDKCPKEPETFNTFEDEDGCPDVKPEGKPQAKEIQRGRVILRGVNFEFGKAVLTGDSYVILDQVYASLVEWPEIKIEIKGHTDSVGSGIANKRLSQKRAESVRDYLVGKGIATNRLVPIGMGEDEPIADNNTAEGRAMNRRVELHRID